MGISRHDLFVRMGVIEGLQPRVDKAVEKAYMDFEDTEYAKVSRSPHGRPWNTSFHASSFPGGAEEKKCGRKALYELMNIPGEKFSPRSRAIMEQGRSAERQIIHRIGLAGMTIGGACALDPDVDSPQLRLEDPEHWLTGSLDAPLDLRKHVLGWDRVTPMDVKSKAPKGLVKLKLKEVEPERGYIAQVMCYSYMCRLVHDQMGWSEMGLREAEGGIIYYVSRENPRETWEHWVEWSQEYVEVGLARLKEWIGLFTEGRLPERPKEWRWTEEPCKWCQFKKLCKKDIKEDVVKLTESNTVGLAKQRNVFYNPQNTINQVVEAWKEG